MENKHNPFITGMRIGYQSSPNISGSDNVIIGTNKETTELTKENIADRIIELKKEVKVFFIEPNMGYGCFGQTFLGPKLPPPTLSIMSDDTLESIDEKIKECIKKLDAYKASLNVPELFSFLKEKVG